MSIGYTIIAVSGKQYNNLTSGEVEILFYYEQGSNIPLPPPKDIFESQRCWIINGYDEHIHNKFSADELFIVKEVQPTRYDNPHHTARGDYHDWAGKGSNVQRLNNELIPIIEAGLPNIDSGEFNPSFKQISSGKYFIEEGGSVYGPFGVTLDTDENEDIHYRACPLNAVALGTKNYHITCSSVSDLRDKNLICETITASGSVLKYITSLRDFGMTAKKYWDEIDYIPMSHIFKKCISPLKVKNKVLIKRSQMYELQKGIESFLDDRGSRLDDPARVERAKNLLVEMQEAGPWESLLEEYLETDLGKKAFKKWLNGNPNMISEQDVSDKKGELSVIERRISERRSVEATLKAGNQEQESVLQNLNNRVKEELAQKKDEYNQEIENLIKDKTEEERGIQQLKAQGQEWVEKYKHFATIDELEEKERRLKKLCSELERDADLHKRTVAKQQEILSKPENLAESLIEVHTIMDSLGYTQFNGRNADVFEKESYSPAPSASFENYPKVGDFVTTIANRINALGSRELSGVEVANILICSQQNLMVILQGRPGVGKTSTVINLAQSLGIKEGATDSGNGDFLNVPVARGWSGSRDLIGYYNSLRGEFQASKTGIYQFLKNGDLEEANNARMILLDEANLSPIEHYWSDFIGLCDKEGADRPINTGAACGEDRYIYPARKGNLRFIATINNDATVEPISSRLLDRAPVICMNVNDDREVEGDIIEIKGAITNELLEQYFGRRESQDNNMLRQSITLIETFVSKGTDKSCQLRECLYLDGRRRYNIEQYLGAAIKAFDSETTAQDFAVSQFLLPHLNCEGITVGEAMKAMLTYAEQNNWKRAQEILEIIIRDSDSYLKHYSFI